MTINYEFFNSNYEAIDATAELKEIVVNASIIAD